MPFFVSSGNDTFTRFRFLTGMWSDAYDNTLMPCEKMYDLIHSTPPIGLDFPKYETMKPLEREGFPSSIEFAKVAFSYPSTSVAANEHNESDDREDDGGEIDSKETPSPRRKYLINEVSFSVARGERVGLMGESGCGKSTLFNLLLRLYDPGEGEIRMHGRRLRDINPTWLRERVVLVSQSSYFAKRTVIDNVMVGPRKKTQERMGE